jgi:hypothetical protein
MRTFEHVNLTSMIAKRTWIPYLHPTGRPLPPLTLCWRHIPQCRHFCLSNSEQTRDLTPRQVRLPVHLAGHLSRLSAGVDQCNRQKDSVCFDFFGKL